MLAVQEYLQNGKTIQDLNYEFAINATYHETEPLVILNYDQIDSVKDHPIVRECRGLTLNTNDWSVQAMAFPRFYNYGECLQYYEDFDWSNIVVEEKLDGSLILMYYYNGWRVNTRASFGQWPICPELTDRTWSEIVYECFIKQSQSNILDLVVLDPNYTYVFELQSFYNKVVVHHSEPKINLLSVFDNKSHKELDEKDIQKQSAYLNIQTPKRFPLKTPEDITNYVNSNPGHLFEGVVIKDSNGKRMKLKNLKYVELHHLRGNNNIFLPKNVLPFVIAGEKDEILTYFPECQPVVDKVEGLLNTLINEAEELYEKHKDIQDQKTFALAVKDSRVASIMFNARKTQKSPVDIIKSSPDFILKHLN